MTGAIIAATLGALAFATGAALQERAILGGTPTAVSGRWGLLLYLFRSPVWLTGTALSGIGTVAHIWALTGAPLTIVQPIGVSGLLCAVVVSAVLHQHKLTGTEIAGCLIVTIGLMALVGTLCGHSGPPVDPPPSTAWMLPVATGLVMLGSLLVSRFVSGAFQAWVLALAGGVGFAALSALVRIIGVSALADPLSVIRPLTLVAAVIGVCGYLFVQGSYRTEHFALAYATLLISDPIAAALIGVSLLGESFPTGVLPVTVIVVSTLVTVGGTVTLARSSADRKRKTQLRAVPSTVSNGPQPSPRPKDAGRRDERPGEPAETSERASKTVSFPATGRPA